MPADFPYMTNPASLGRFLEKIRMVGVPEKVTIAYLNSLGFKSTNDRPIVSTLKFLGFVDNAGVPSDTWQRYRPKETAGAVLAEAIRTAYSELFAIYPDAERKDNEALRNFFSTHTKVGEATLNLIVRTFKVVCDAADFASAAPPKTTGQAGNQEATKTVTVVKQGHSNGPAININIQLQLQATEDPKVYDNFFAAMKKHLFPTE